MDLYFYFSKIISPIILPSNFLIICLLIFFYLGILKNLKFFKKIFKIFFIIFSILVIFPIGKNLFYYFLEKEFYEQEIPNKIDYIFVPSGGTDRIVEAIRIKNKYNLSNTKILYSTGVAYLDKNKITNKEENYTKNLILNSKIDQNDIIFLPNARNTLENFERLNSYLIKSNSKESHILLITHAFHIKRCLIFAKKHDINLTAYASSYLTRSPATGIINSYQRTCFICNLSFFDLFIKEFISLSVAKFL